MLRCARALKREKHSEGVSLLGPYFRRATGAIDPLHACRRVAVNLSQRPFNLRRCFSFAIEHIVETAFDRHLGGVSNKYLRIPLTNQHLVMACESHQICAWHKVVAP